MLCCNDGCRSGIAVAELKGNPAEIRNYPRSCKSLLLNAPNYC
jgi:hypothetical protein